MDDDDSISRQAALDALEWKWAGKAAIDAIKGLPTIDPVKHGKWMTEDGKTTVCSSCGDIWGHTDLVLKYMRYCPNCGAKMNVDECGNIVAYRKDGTSVWDRIENWR